MNETTLNPADLRSAAKLLLAVLDAEVIDENTWLGHTADQLTALAEGIEKKKNEPALAFSSFPGGASYYIKIGEDKVLAVYTGDAVLNGRLTQELDREPAYWAAPVELPN